MAPITAFAVEPDGDVVGLLWITAEWNRTGVHAGIDLCLGSPDEAKAEAPTSSGTLALEIDD